MSLLHNAIASILPHGTKKSAYADSIRHTFNCPVCSIRGHSADKSRRGAFFLKHDGSATYSCFQCGFRTAQSPDKSLSKGMDYILEHMGMGQDARKKLGYDLWSAGYQKRTGLTAKPFIQKQPLPASAKPIGEWIADNIADANFNDVLFDLAEMTDRLRDSYYWTPDAGQSGDMNRRFIWAFADASNSIIGWAAHPLSDAPDADVIQSDPNILFHEA